MNNQDDAVFVRNFTLVLVGLAVVGIMAFVLAKLVNGHYQASLATSSAVEARIAPVGQVNTDSSAVSVGAATGSAAVAAAPAPAAAVADAPARSGKDVYDGACFVCHTPGAAGAPKFGDATAWAPRIEKGKDALYHSALNGLMGSAGMMPPKGGRPDLSDQDVMAAVDYMVENGQ